MKKNGFTFIELSIVMVILAILVAGSMPIGISIIKSGKVQTTEQRLDAIEEALKSYLITHGTLPCPASPTEVPGDTNFGVEARTSATVCNTSYSGIVYDGTHGFIYGAVPVRTLNMTDYTMSDGWDNKIIYAVSEVFAEDFENQIVTAGSITVNTSSGADTITDDAIYVLLSPGANRSGAYPIEVSAQINTSPSNAGEAENANRDYVFRDYEYDEDFDDSVRFKTKMQMVFDVEWEDVGCVGLEAYAIDGYTWPTTITPYGQIAESTSPTGHCRKCYKYSRWGDVYETNCP